jgi:molybdate transport system permease protein
MLGVDRRLEDVSRSLGRGPVDTFLRVTLPLALPGVTAGAVLSFARALGEFGATIVLAGNVAGETRTIPVAVYTLLNVRGGEALAMRLVGVSVALALAALLGSFWLSARQRRA